MKQAANNVKTQPADRVGLFMLSRGILVSYLITLPLFAVFAALLTYSGFPEKYIPTAVLITTVVSVMIAGWSTTLGIRNKGWLNGAMVGFVYMLVLYILSSIVFANFKIDQHVVTMTLIGVLAGAIGGIIGINLQGKGKGRRKR